MLALRKRLYIIMLYFPAALGCAIGRGGELSGNYEVFATSYIESSHDSNCPVVSKEGTLISFFGEVFMRGGLSSNDPNEFVCAFNNNDLIFKYNDPEGIFPKELRLSDTPPDMGILKIHKWTESHNDISGEIHRKYKVKGGEGGPSLEFDENIHITTAIHEGRKTLVVEKITIVTQAKIFGRDRIYHIQSKAVFAETGGRFEPAR
jgi:hypothetical protein